MMLSIDRWLTYGSTMDRVAVIGTSCSGKTTFARQLADITGFPLADLDQLYWGPHWTPRATNDFERDVTSFVSQERWVIAGNYSMARPLIWPQADTIVWLNYPFRIVWTRALRRTIGRSWNREELFNGNRESWRMSLFSRDSILLWVMKSYRPVRREYGEVLAQPEFAHLEKIVFSHPDQAERWLMELAAKR